MLKKLALILSLVAALGIGGGALAFTASAANCTPSTGNVGITSDPTTFFTATLACSNVDKVIFSTGYINVGGGGCTCFWVANNPGSDQTRTVSVDIHGNSPAVSQTYYFCKGCLGPGSRRLCGLGDGPISPNYTRGVFNFYIHNKVTQTWGSVAQYAPNTLWYTNC